MNIYVANIIFRASEDELKAAFAQYGEVSSVKILKDRETNRSRGFGFVEMPNDDEAQKAIDELNGATVDGRTIVVNKSEPKPEGERRSFNNNRSGGSGGYNGGGNSRGGGSYNDRNSGGRY